MPRVRVEQAAALRINKIGIVTVLHERMHQIERFREDLGRPG